MIKFLILANNGSCYYRDPRWPKYNTAYLSWFLSFTDYEVIEVLDQPRDILIDKIDDFISSVSSDDLSFVYMAGIGGNRNGANYFLPYEQFSMDEGLVDIDEIIDKFQGKPVVVFLDVYAPRGSFRKFDFRKYSNKNCYIAYSCVDTHGPVADGTVFTGRLIRSMFAHSGNSLLNVLDSFQVSMSKDKKTKSQSACAYDSLSLSMKQTFLQGVIDNPDYQIQKNEPEDFQWVYNTWRKLRGEEELDIF